jgi:hypothetical protein
MAFTYTDVAWLAEGDELGINVGQRVWAVLRERL